ncbi:MAG: LLM class flavin-dependent oxidoreductase [Actinobacteria bacterium]|nr:LLM class flavin-dependent oxidoreductase [Actinomycetota bacterium]
MADIHVGVTVPQIKRSWQESRSAATEFEAMGFDSLWVCDHLYGPQSPTIPILEAWSLLAGLAAVTDRVELGTLVTPTGMRNPAHLGKVVATVDAIAGGRIIPGFGAGWMAREHTDFGMPFLPTAQRMDQLAETIDLLRAMWDPAVEAATYHGTHVHADDVVCLPKPPRRPPILIGGAGEQRTIPLAARVADIWNNLAGTQAELPHKVDRLRAELDRIGRDPAEVTISQQCLVIIAADEAAAETAIQQAEKIFGGHLGDPRGDLAIAGTPERVVEQIRRHVDLGCTMFIAEFFGRETITPARLFAERVLPELKG